MNVPKVSNKETGKMKPRKANGDDTKHISLAVAYNMIARQKNKYIRVIDLIITGTD